MRYPFDNGLTGSRLVAILISIVVMTSCTVTTYRDVPRIDVHTLPLSPKDFAIYYRVDPVSYFRKVLDMEQADFFYAFPARLEDYDELRRVFAESGIFASAIPSPTPPDKGIYCSVEVEYIPLSERAALFLSISQSTAAILPSYNGSSGHTVKYDLYVDNELKKTYAYTITKKQTVWALLLPFAWINLTTHGLDEAFRATAYQFFVDAAVDGYLTPS